MGVAGDGNKKLENFDMSAMAKSKTMSAKNAWGKTTGYAEQLIAQGMEAQRAQQLENWKNQQEGSCALFYEGGDNTIKFKFVFSISISNKHFYFLFARYRQCCRHENNKNGWLTNLIK